MIYLIFLLVLSDSTDDSTFNLLKCAIETPMNMTSIVAVRVASLEVVKIGDPIFPSPWIRTSENEN